MSPVTLDAGSAHTRSQYIITLILSGVFFMEMVDGSALNTSLPQIASDFHLNILNVKAAITIYFLSLGLFIPLCKWLADNYRTKSILLVSVSSFMVASLGCGLSPSIKVLIACRALQGAAAAFMMPAIRILLVKIFRGDTIIDAMNIIMPVGLIGFILGPLLGGTLTTYYSWRWIFVMNLPVFIFLAFCISRYIPADPVRSNYKNTAFDWAGFVLFSLSIGLILVSADRFSHVPVNFSNSSLFIFMIGIICFIFFFRHCGLRETALIDVKLFSLKRFMLGTCMSFLSRCVSGAIPFVFPVMLQNVYHKTPVQSGYIILYVAAGMISSRVFVKKYITKLRYKVRTITSLSLMMLVQIYWVFTIKSGALIYLTSSLFLYGFILTVLLSTIDTSIYKSIADSYMNDGVIIHSITVQLTNAIAIAISSAVLACSMVFISSSITLSRGDFVSLFTVMLVFPVVSIMICLFSR